MADGRRSNIGWRAALAAAAGGALLGSYTYARTIERLRVELVRTRVSVTSTGLPPDGLRILHLSDLHFAGRGVVEQRKLAITQALLGGLSYDLLLITGDFIHDDGGLARALAFVEGLPRPRLGAFGCLGNHDYANYSLSGIVRQTWATAGVDRLRATARQVRDLVASMFGNERLHLGIAQNDVPALVDALATRGVHILRNENVRLTAGGADIWLAGLDDVMEGQPDIDAALAGWPAGPLTIMLAHHPDLFLEPALQQFDLGLSGHVHGGQIRLPLVGALYTGSHLSRHRMAGWFRFGATQVYVSRGLGESTLLRFRCRPEVTLIDLVPAGAG